MRQQLHDLVGMLGAPVATLRALTARGRPPLWPPLSLWLAVLVLLQAKLLVRFAYLLPDGGSVMLRRVREALWEPSRTDVFALVATAASVAVGAAKKIFRIIISPCGNTRALGEYCFYEEYCVL